MNRPPKHARQLATIVRERLAVAKARDPYGRDTQDLADALAFLTGKPFSNDHKIDIRRRGERQDEWSWTLVQGSMGYSAANPVVRIGADGKEIEIPR